MPQTPPIQNGQQRFTGKIYSGVQGATAGAIILANVAAGAFQTTIVSAPNASAAWTLQLPPNPGTAGYVLQTNGAGITSWVAQSGGGGSPGGSPNQFQYNAAGSFGGLSGITTTDGTDLVAASGKLKLSGSSSGTVILNAPATGGGTITLPQGSATLARTDAGQTFTGVQVFSTPIAATSVATMTATVGGGVPTPPNNTTSFLRGDGTWAVPAGGGGSPGGADTQVQYNSAGSFVATANFTTNGTGQQIASGATTTSPGWYAQVNGDSVPRIRVGLNATDVASIGLGSGSATRDLFLERAGAANLRYGGADAASPVAQTISVQNVVAGTSNTAGANFTIAGSIGTGTGVGGSIIFQVAPAGSTGSTQNALATALTIDSTKLATFAGNITIGANNFFIVSGRSKISSVGDSIFNFQNNSSSASAPIQIGANNSWRHGSIASATPAAQTLIIGENSRGAVDSNVAGSSGTIQSGAGTGTGTPTSLIFQTPALAASGTTQQTLTTRLSLGLSAVFGNAAIATNATDGFVYIPTCAGTPTGTPTSNTGRVALVYDTTNHQFWIYDGGWLQPKTPAGAALVTWQ